MALWGSGVRIPSAPVYARSGSGERGLSRRSLGEGGHPFTLRRFSQRATTRQARAMTNFLYVYILQSDVDPGRFYTGLTDDLRQRLKCHNSARVRHTTKWKPWRLKAYFALGNRMRAAEFERYLKSASGRAFVKKHL
jgi:putative endonuclease